MKENSSHLLIIIYMIALNRGIIFALTETKFSVINFGQNTICSMLSVVGMELKLFFIITNTHNVIFLLQQSKVVCISDPKLTFHNSPLIVLVLNTRKRSIS